MGFSVSHRPESDSCAAAEEFVLVRSMMMAAIEERYSDAGNSPSNQIISESL